jgi:hypothetical protein
MTSPLGPTTGDRPRPILDAIRSGQWKTLVGTAISAAVSFGVLDSQQTTVVNNLVAAAVTLITALTALLGQLHVLRRAEPLVTPVASPRSAAGVPLVPADTAMSQQPPTT